MELFAYASINTGHWTADWQVARAMAEAYRAWRKGAGSWAAAQAAQPPGRRHPMHRVSFACLAMAPEAGPPQPPGGAGAAGALGTPGTAGRTAATRAASPAPGVLAFGAQVALELRKYHPQVVVGSESGAVAAVRLRFPGTFVVVVDLALTQDASRHGNLVVAAAEEPFAHEAAEETGVNRVEPVEPWFAGEDPGDVAVLALVYGPLLEAEAAAHGNGALGRLPSRQRFRRCEDALVDGVLRFFYRVEEIERHR